MEPRRGAKNRCLLEILNKIIIFIIAQTK
jgi:hypothetical protein